MISDLLSTAETLALIDRTRPRQVNFRKSVSNAYYAMFHALAQVGAETLVGRSAVSKPADVRIYRSLTHTQAKRVLGRPEIRSLNPDLYVFARAFIVLQELRETADYDPFPFLVSRETARGYVNLARTAIALLSVVPAEVRLELATLLFFMSRK